MSETPASPLIVKLSCDASRFNAAVDEAGRLFAELPDPSPEFLLNLDRLIERGAFFRREGDCLPTSATDKGCIVLEPSDGFLRLLTAMRAGHVDLETLNNCFDHDLSSVGCVEPSNEGRASGESQDPSGARSRNAQEVK